MSQIVRLISSDGIGFLGNVNQFLYLYKDFFQAGFFDGVEMIAFAPLSRRQNFINTLEKHNIKVISFHGRTGGEKDLRLSGRLIMTIVNQLILSAEDLVKNFSDFEFLFHAPYLQDKKVFDFIVKNKNKIKKIWVENHLDGIEGVKKMQEIVIQLQKNQVTASGLIDIYHVVSKLSTDEIVLSWEKIVNEIASNLSFVDGIHLPIGTRLDDSIPIDFLTDKQLNYFYQKIVLKVRRVVLENQQKNLGLLYSTAKMLEKQRERNEKVFLRLRKVGII
ncbi:MAG: hypothetical protein ACPLRN_03375 [Microgenomates group bacterium]